MQGISFQRNNSNFEQDLREIEAQAEKIADVFQEENLFTFPVLEYADFVVYVLHQAKTYGANAVFPIKFANGNLQVVMEIGYKNVSTDGDKVFAVPYISLVEADMDVLSDEAFNNNKRNYNVLTAKLRKAVGL